MKAVFEKLCVGVWIMALSASCAIAAMAADGPSPVVYPIHIHDALQLAIVAIFTALSGAVSWFVALILGRVSRKFKIQIHNEVSLAVESAILEGLAYAREAALEKAMKIEDPVTRSEILARAVNYVLDRFPRLVKDAKLDKDRLHVLAAAQLPPPKEAVLESANH